MIIEYDESGFATNLGNVHDPQHCEDQLCDVHGRFGEEPWASWVRNFREDRGIVEMIDPRSDIGHPTPAQVQYWESLADRRLISRSMAGHEAAHECDGGCRGAFDQID